MVAVAASGTRSVHDTRLGTRLDNAFAAVCSGHRAPVAAAAAVLVDGEPLWSAARGPATPAGESTATTTAFPVASLTKVVTTVGVLTLVRDGVLDLDADVNGYVDRPVIAASGGAPVTLRHLLTHTAGLGIAGRRRDFLVPWRTWGERRAAPRPAAELHGPRLRTLSDPETSWTYGSHGHGVVERVVEAVTGQTFPAVMARRVLAPLALVGSAYGGPPPGRLAGRGCRRRRKRIKWWAPRAFSPVAGGGLWSCVDDLAALIAELVRNGDGLLPVELRRALFIPQPFAGAPHPFQALGLHLDGLADDPVAHHGGHWWGVRATLHIAPASRAALVVISTGAPVGNLAWRLGRGLAELAAPPCSPVRRAALAPAELAGTYRPRGRVLGALTLWLALGGRLRVLAEAGRLHLRSRWGPLRRGVSLEPLGDDRYAYAVIGGAHRVVAFRATRSGTALFLTSPQAVVWRAAAPRGV
ncbi:MAG: serine hydrolase domain-containing protein [Actinomycetota bacterium]